MTKRKKTARKRIGKSARKVATRRKPVARKAAPKAAISKGQLGAVAISVTGRDEAFIRAGTRFAGILFKKLTPIAAPAGGYVSGTDYAVHILRGKPVAKPFDGKMRPNIIGGYHFAPGGCGGGGRGGDIVSAINPYSAWDRDFRPAAKDLRGMVLVTGPRGRFWCDIYLLGANHMDDGTSRFGVTIADGNDPPQNPAGGTFAKCDYATAGAVMKHHGKQLLGAEEFFAAAYGVTERTAAGTDPKITGVDAARTSFFGIMQATGNMWVWGTDGHPDDPRPSIFGGSWFLGSVAGSRYADLVYWPGDSHDNLGARGRSDHLQLA